MLSKWLTHNERQEEAVMSSKQRAKFKHLVVRFVSSVVSVVVAIGTSVVAGALPT